MLPLGAVLPLGTVLPLEEATSDILGAMLPLEEAVLPLGKDIDIVCRSGPLNNNSVPMLRRTWGNSTQ